MSTATFIGGKAFKNLTTNQTYPVILKDGDYLFVRNNKDSVQKYHQKYFNNIMIPTTVPVAPPVLAPLTEQEMIDSISVDDTEITFKTPCRNEIFIDVNDFLNINETDISCGIIQISGINNLVDEIYDHFTGENGFEDDSDELFKKLIKTALSRDVILNLEDSKSFSFSLISTNQGCDTLDEILSEICEKSTDWVNNPNSGNNIKLWVLNNDWE